MARSQSCQHCSNTISGTDDIDLAINYANHVKMKHPEKYAVVKKKYEQQYGTQKSGCFETFFGLISLVSIVMLTIKRLFK